jgi:hypothetical protein
MQQHQFQLRLWGREPSRDRLDWRLGIAGNRLRWTATGQAWRLAVKALHRPGRKYRQQERNRQYQAAVHGRRRKWSPARMGK